jgi:hypothetical protein
MVPLFQFFCVLNVLKEIREKPCDDCMTLLDILINGKGLNVCELHYFHHLA